jgi:hypothetical protein
LLNENEFGGNLKFPGLSRSSVGFCEDGCYWNGGIFPPMIWISILGLKESGRNDLAQLVNTEYYNYFMKSYKVDGSVCEYFAPKLNNGSLLCGKNPPAKRDFYGWGSLPLGLFNL